MEREKKKVITNKLCTRFSFVFLIHLLNTYYTRANALFTLQIGTRTTFNWQSSIVMCELFKDAIYESCRHVAAWTNFLAG